MASLVSLVGVVRDLKPDSFVLDDRTGWILCSLVPLDKTLLREKRPLHDGRYARVSSCVENSKLGRNCGICSLRRTEPQFFSVEGQFATIQRRVKFRSPQVLGRIEREVATNELGEFETGGFVVSVVHCEGLESLNAIFDHMMQTTQAKLLYITMGARYRKEFGSDTVQ